MGTAGRYDRLIRAEGAARVGGPAAMGGMLATLAFALLPARPEVYSDDQVIDTVTGLLLGGLRG